MVVLKNNPSTTRVQGKIKNFPDKPGIYLFYNSQKELVYVGKATSLRNRVRSYFVGARTSRPIEQMIHEVMDIKNIQTDSVLEAIILEANYIKKFQPKYNVDLKDDKSWNYIIITNDEYPTVSTIREHELYVANVQIVKNVVSDKKLQHLKHLQQFQHIFGLYPGLKTKEMMSLLRKLFYISTCESGKSKPCFYRQLGQCLGVCTGEISPAEYKKKVIKPLVHFLSGKKKSLLKSLETEMKQASKQHEFEEAGRLRDQIRQLNRIQDVALLNKDFVENDLKIKNLDLKIRVEGYDISNLGETGKVGSMVVFVNGESNKSQYRKFKIKTVVGQSDVDCLGEVLERRLKHAEWPLPEVFLIDGGKPQVNRVVKILSDRKIVKPIVGIAKGKERKKNDFMIANNTDKNFIKWVYNNKKLLIQVRDEAHRFAISYQRTLRKI